MIPAWGGLLLALGGAAAGAVWRCLLARRTSDYAQGHKDGIAAGRRAERAVRL